jgi:hypothetical protein
MVSPRFYKVSQVLIALISPFSDLISKYYHIPAITTIFHCSDTILWVFTTIFQYQTLFYGKYHLIPLFRPYFMENPKNFHFQGLSSEKLLPYSILKPYLQGIC